MKKGLLYGLMIPAFCLSGCGENNSKICYMPFADGEARAAYTDNSKKDLNNALALCLIADGLDPNSPNYDMEVKLRQAAIMKGADEMLRKRDYLVEGDEAATFRNAMNNHYLDVLAGRCNSETINGVTDSLRKRGLSF